jgi:predicted NAD/FAD-binding protein
MNKNRRIAVVGSGVSGAIAAWLLKDTAQVTLLESDSRFGGHTHTFTVEEDGAAVPVDTGFMVFNRPNYPLLSALFEHLGVAVYPTDMSFSASFDEGRFEYAGSDLNGLFGQRRNLLNPRFWRMLRDILRFNRHTQRAAAGALPDELTLSDYLDEVGIGADMRERYLYPMAAAIWSCPDGQVAHFPATSFLRFFRNHGLSQLSERPQWMTLENGSRSYMDRLITDLGTRARCNAAVSAVRRTQTGVSLHMSDGSVATFDDVVLACHSDQSLALLADASPAERQLLGAIGYQANRVVLHRDRSLMPKERRVWASWNYVGHTQAGKSPEVSVSYWMNSLQRLATDTDYFVSLNPLRDPRRADVVAEFDYRHPVFDAAALQAQRQLGRIQGTAHTWFAGAWTGYGFHEDGMRSGVEGARALGASIPWSEQLEASRSLFVASEQPRRAA